MSDTEVNKDTSSCISSTRFNGSGVSRTCGPEIPRKVSNLFLEGLPAQVVNRDFQVLAPALSCSKTLGRRANGIAWKCFSNILDLSRKIHPKKKSSPEQVFPNSFCWVPDSCHRKSGRSSCVKFV